MDTGLYFSCQIDGLNKTTFKVVDFTLEEAISTLYTLEVMLATTETSIDMDQQLLREVSFVVSVDGEVQRTVNGIVAEISRGNSGFELTYYKVVIRPSMWLMTLNQNNRIFHFKSIPDILRELLGEYSITSTLKTYDNHKQWEYTTQRNESDYHFFSRLAAEEGIAFWFEEDKLYAADHYACMLQGPAMIYNPHIQSPCREPVIHSLHYGAKMTTNAVHLKEYVYTHPNVKMSVKNKAAKKQPQFTLYESYGRYDDEQVADQYARYRLEQQKVNSLSGSAESNCIQVMPATMLGISEHPTDSMNRRWQVISVVHRGSLPQSVGKESGDKPATLSNHFTFIPDLAHFRPPLIDKPTVFGNETAKVVGPAGEEIYTNEYGEVKIHFHWNLLDPEDEKASCWVRAGQSWNGSGFGVMALPRIGQEVIISYLNGDIDRPIIVGTVYNGRNAPPVELPAKKTRMTIRSKTHKGQGFNEIGFEDECGSEEFYFHAQKDMNTDVLNNKGTHVINDHTENVDNNQTMAIGVDQTLTVGNNQAGTIGVDQTLDVGNDQTNTIGNNQSSTIGVDQSWVIGSNQTSTIGSNQTDTIGANRSATVGSNDILTVSGNQAETVIIAKAETIGAAKALSIGAAYQITVGGLMNTSVALAQSSQVGLTKSMIIGKNYSQNVGQNKVTVVAKNNSTKAGQHIKFQAGDSFTIVCGKSKLVMDKSGKITLNGKDLIVSTTAKQTFKAKGDIKLKGKKIHEN